MPSFTILISNYNYGNFIVEALESVARQNHSQCSMIIIDDGSTDISVELIKSFQANHLNSVLLLQTPRLGQAAALNAGFLQSSGEYLLFLDSDDLFLSHKVLAISRYIHQYPHLGVLQHDLLEIDQRGSPLGTRFGVNSSATGCKLYGGNVLGRILDQDTPYSWFFAPTSGLCLRRDFAEKIFPLPSEFRICADVPIAYGAAVLGEVGLIEEPLGCYRLHSKSGYASQLKSSPPGWAAEQFLNSLERYSLLLDMKKAGKFEALVNRNLPNLQQYERYWEFFYRVVHPCMRFAAYKLVSLRFAEFRAGKVDFWYLISKLFDDLVFMLNSKERGEYRKAFYSRFHRLTWTSRMLLGSH